MAALVLGKGAHEITCETARMGGAFGGKESQAANYASLAALAATRSASRSASGSTAKTTWRLPVNGTPCVAYKAGFSAEGDLTALQVEIYSDGGWTVDLSPGVHDRHVPPRQRLLHPQPRSTRRAAAPTASAPPPSCFGGPQGVVVVEEAIARFAERQVETLRKFERNYYAEGERDWAPYGQKIEEIRLQRSMKSCWRRATTRRIARRSTPSTPAAPRQTGSPSSRSSLGSPLPSRCSTRRGRSSSTPTARRRSITAAPRWAGSAQIWRRWRLMR